MLSQGTEAEAPTDSSQSIPFRLRVSVSPPVNQGEAVYTQVMTFILVIYEKKDNPGQESLGSPELGTE